MGFADYLKTEKDEGKEKHVPALDVKECSSCGELTLTSQVGKETLHPSTAEHHIEWIQLFGEKQDGLLAHVATIVIGGENALPRGKVNIRKGDFRKLTAVSFCNKHGVWENRISL